MLKHLLPSPRVFLVLLLTLMAFLPRGASVALGTETQLLSITGLDLQPLKGRSQSSPKYVAGFDIKTWAVRVLAVCHIPGGWTVTAGKNANPEGELSGSAGEGVAFLGSENLAELTDFFLVQVEDYHPDDRGDCTKACTPATFAGVIYVGQYGSEDQPRSERLITSNIKLVPASRCPDPH